MLNSYYYPKGRRKLRSSDLTTSKEWVRHGTEHLKREQQLEEETNK